MQRDATVAVRKHSPFAAALIGSALGMVAGWSLGRLPIALLEEPFGQSTLVSPFHYTLLIGQSFNAVQRVTKEQACERMGPEAKQVVCRNEHLPVYAWFQSR